MTRSWRMETKRVRGLPRRFRWPWRSAADIRRDVDDELEFHLAQCAEALERQGLSPAAARREALRRFGDVDAARRALTAAAAHNERGSRARLLLESLARDVGHALRGFRRSAGFAIAATLVLALGIGSSVLVFSMLDTLVLRPLPLHEPERLFAIGTQPPPDAQWTMQTVRLSVVDEWEARAGSLDGVAAFLSPSVTWRGPNGPERIIAGAVVAGDLFRLLGAPLALGRPFGPAESEAVPAVLSHSFWRQRFGSRADVIGETIELDGVTHTIVGVLPPETGLPILGAQRLVWIPQDAAGAARDRLFASVIGRLRPNVGETAAAAELAALQRNVEDERGFRPKQRGVVLQSMQANRTALVGATLFALLGGALLLLLIACANVATLSLARLIERRHDFAVRSSLGATGARLARQIVTEQLLLWSIGGGLGLLLGAVGLRVALGADPLPAAQVPADAIAVDGRVVAFAAVVTLGTALVFGLLTARGATRTSPVATLRQDGATVSASRAARGSRQALVVAQVALSTLLASAGCLLALSFYNLTSQPLGFRPDGLLTFRVQLPAQDYPDQASRAVFQRALIESLAALPGVDAATTTSAVPLGTLPVGPISIEGRDSSGEPPYAGFQAVDHGFHSIAGIPVVAGRALTAADRAGGDPVVVVNETFAATYFPGGPAVGRRISLPAPGGAELAARIVGVVGDVKHAGLDWEYLPEVFLPYEQLPDGAIGAALGAELFAVVRAADARLPSAPVLRDLLARLDPDLPLMEIRTGRELLAAAAKEARFRATLIGAVAALAVLLAGVGLFAVLRQSVAQRHKEFGIRLAIGAPPRALLASVCGAGVRLAAVGVVAGTLGTFALARLVRALLFGVAPVEPLVSLAVAAFMLLIAIAAAAVPAWRSSRISPTLAIRHV